MINLPDIQKNKEGFPQLPINKVGVRNIKVPFNLKTKEGNIFSTIANISSYCDLVEDVKGINMSRISRTINDILAEDNELGFDNLNKFVHRLQEAHGTENVYIKAAFKFIYKSQTPMSKIITHEPVDVIFESILMKDEVSNYITVESIENSLCPCSKEMSLLWNNLDEEEIAELDMLFDNPAAKSLEYKLKNAGFGAHNQRSQVRIKVETHSGIKNIMWIEDLITIIRSSVSSPTWSTLKRQDEKWVTEVGYMGGYYDENKKFVKVGSENQFGAMFVEDIARSVAEKLNKELDNRITDYLIVVNNQESIHSDDIMATAILNANRWLK